MDSDAHAPTAKIATTPLRQQVYQRIEEMIVSGVAKPGDRLPETELAQALQVSRGPVREALQMLEREGWVEVRPRHGAIVRRRSTRELEELLEVRRILEVNAVRLAARYATSEQRAELKRLGQEARRAVRAKNLEALLRTNQLTHDAFTHICGNSALDEIVHSLGRRLRWYTRRPSIGERALTVLEEHEEIAAAILACNPEAAARAMNRHILRDWETYRQTIGINLVAFEDVA